jgi:hypothetical protein
VDLTGHHQDQLEVRGGQDQWLELRGGMMMQQAINVTKISNQLQIDLQ